MTNRMMTMSSTSVVHHPEAPVNVYDVEHVVVYRFYQNTDVLSHLLIMHTIIATLCGSIVSYLTDACLLINCCTL